MLMKTEKHIYSLILLLLFVSVSCSEKGHKIAIQVDGLSNAEVKLGYHFSGRQYVVDTVATDEAGRAVFKGTDRLPRGLYIVTLPEDKYLEVIVDTDQVFDIETSIKDPLGTTRFSGAAENSSFYEYLLFLRDRQQRLSEIHQQLETPALPQEQRQTILQERDAINQKIKKKQESHIKAFPKGLLTLIFQTQREVDVPPPMRKQDGSEDVEAAYRQYKKDFWKRVDFSDNRLLRTPVYYAKLVRYFTGVVAPDPDTVIREAERVIGYAGADDEMFTNTVFILAGIFDRFSVTGFDSAFVHIVETYYQTGKVPVDDEAVLESIIRRAERLKPTLIGSVAPDIEMVMTDNATISLHRIPAQYMVVYFWNSECVYCDKLTPELNLLYEKYREKDMVVFSVNTEEDTGDWQNYIEKNNIVEWLNVSDPENRSGFRQKYNVRGVPLLFLLDRDKKIIAKNIDIRHLEHLLKEMYNE